MPELTIQHMPWLTPPMQVMVAALRRRQLANAYLVHGQSGSGHRELAYAVQAIVMCSQPSDGLACGRCSSCRLLVSGVHPDAWKVEPHTEGHPIKVDQVRELSEHLEQTAQLGGYRCIVIEPGDALNVAAANSLLKLLEEPGEDVVFLLVSEYPERLLPTIRSRCQSLPVRIPGQDELFPWLRSQLIGLDNGQLLKAWEWGGRTPLNTLTLLESDELDQIDACITQWSGLVSSTDIMQWSKLCDQWGVEWVLNVLHRYASIRVSEVEGSSGERSDEAWFWLSDQLVELKRLRISGANLNAQLMWEKLVLQWQAVCNRPPLLKVCYVEA